jgi:hypothetical protein
MREINLLPKPKQQELRYEVLLNSLYKVIGISVVSFVLVFSVKLGTKLYLGSELASIQNQSEQLKGLVDKQDNAAIKNQIGQVNNEIADFSNLSAATPKWSKVLKAFAVLPPSGVKINSFVLDFGKKTVNINGTSPTRELVIQTYYNILRDSKEFYDIDYPLENIAKPKDINFHFTFFVRDDLLK